MLTNSKVFLTFVSWACTNSDRVNKLCVVGPVSTGQRLTILHSQYSSEMRADDPTYPSNLHRHWQPTSTDITLYEREAVAPAAIITCAWM